MFDIEDGSNTMEESDNEDLSRVKLMIGDDSSVMKEDAVDVQGCHCLS
jgi:hypothetical protein